MARLGARVKKLRSLGVDLPGLTRKTRERRPYPPGQHGPTRRKKLTDYALRLLEKQKLRVNYGLRESQLRRIVREAMRSTEPTDVKLVELLERRLDNVVFRSGFAPTIPAARQLVNHGHVLVNGKRVDIPSYRVRVGDRIELTPSARDNVYVRASVAEPALIRPGWLRFDEATTTATVEALPDRDAIPFPVDLRMVIELYAGRL